MSAFNGNRWFGMGIGRRRGWAAVLCAFVACSFAGLGIRAGRQQPRRRHRVARELRPRRRALPAEDPAREPAGELRDPESAAHRARLPRHRQWPRRDAAGGRRSRAAQPQRDPGGQSHARRVQPQQAAVVRHAGRGQHGRRHAQRPGNAQGGHGNGPALRRTQGGRGAARAARRRLPARPQRRRPDRRRPVRRVGRHRHPPAGQEPGRRLPEDVGAAQPRAAHRRRRLRHADRVGRDLPAGRQRADGHRAQGPVGAFGVPDRQPLHPRSEAHPGRPEQADPGLARRLQGREAVAQLPERRSARGAAGDRRLHGPQHHHQRHRAGQPDAAPEGHPLGPGARHHPADQGPRHAQERQCRAHRAARGTGAQGEAAARKRDPDRRTRAARLRVVPAELHQGAGHPEPDHEQPAAAVRRGRRADGHHGWTGVDHQQARRRDHRPALEHPVRHRYGVAAGGSAQDHPPDRHADQAGADRGADRDRQRSLQPAARHPVRPADGLHVHERQVRGGLVGLAQHDAGGDRRKATGWSARRARRRRSNWRREWPPPATPIRRS